jgi:hypothetical protein
MKAAKKNPFRKIIYTPENIGGPCMIVRPMTDAEAIELAEWVKKRKAALKAKQLKQ